MIYIVSTLVTANLFISLILLLAAKPQISRRITIGALTIAGVSGLLIYGYGYTVITDNFLLAVLKALMAVCGSFIGKSEYSALSSVPIMQTTGMQIYCAFVQVCALYATASAIITSIGAQMLKRLRLFLARRGPLNIIYGNNPDALDFGNELISEKRGAVIFVDDEASASTASAIADMGCVLQTDSNATAGNVPFLRSIGFRSKSRKLTLYALNKSSTANIRYAARLLQSLKICDIKPENLRLVISAQENTAVSHLQVRTGQYGYGFVTAVNEPQMAARLLTLYYPPCETVSFDYTGKATENFEALLVGFGQVGQAVLKSIVMNGQFEGSTMKLAVFAPDCNQTDGRLAAQCHSLYTQYDISFHNHDARSREMYSYLRERGNRLKYAVICTGDAALNHEIAEDLTDYFHNAGYSVPVFSCSRQDVRAYNSDGTVANTHKLYHHKLLCSDRLDQAAMLLNQKYVSPTEKTALQNWMECDYFSRQSCRAFTDFLPALLRAAGKTALEVSNGDWNLTQAQLENLSKIEHLRWCAFHYCMGFSSMSNQEFDERSAIFRAQKEQDGKASIRIAKNMTGLTHACLIPWDELDALSEKEAAITGKPTDYKAADTANILAIPELLQANGD